MAEALVLRVFTDAMGGYGNPLAVVPDGARIPASKRARVARDLGYSETVFVDDGKAGCVRIFDPSGELPFAGHPLVGTAWALARLTGTHPEALYPPAGRTPTWTDGERVWIRGRLGATPPWWHERLATAEEVDAIREPSPAQDATQFWAWQDELEGKVRARVFASRFGVQEDEACGSASMRLAAALGRELVIQHGEGSIIHVSPGPDGTADVGGLVASDGTRLLP